MTTGHRIFFGIAVSIILILTAIIFLSNKKADTHFNYLDFFIGRVGIIKNNRAVEAAEIKKKLFPGDTVKTGAETKAFIQLGADNMVQVNENTEISMAGLPGMLESSDGKTSLELRQGKILMFLKKLGKNGEFFVKYRTTVIGVRGTAFSMEGSDDVLSVTVLEGSVSIKSDKNDFPGFIIESGKKGVIKGADVKIGEMNRSDLDSFREITALRPLAGISCMPKEYVEEYFIWRLDIKKHSRGDEKVPDEEKKTSSLEKESKTDSLPAHTDARIRIKINPLTANGVEPGEASDITEKLYNRLAALKGGDSIIYNKSGDISKSANRQLTGRISKLGASYIIAVSVSHGETGRVMFTKTVTVKPDQVDNALSNLASQVNASDDIWAVVK